VTVAAVASDHEPDLGGHRHRPAYGAPAGERAVRVGICRVCGPAKARGDLRSA
jgi:hypothetical protein